MRCRWVRRGGIWGFYFLLNFSVNLKYLQNIKLIKKCFRNSLFCFNHWVYLKSIICVLIENSSSCCFVKKNIQFCLRKGHLLPLTARRSSCDILALTFSIQVNHWVQMNHLMSACPGFIICKIRMIMPEDT